MSLFCTQEFHCRNSDAEFNYARLIKPPEYLRSCVKIRIEVFLLCANRVSGNCTRTCLYLINREWTLAKPADAPRNSICRGALARRFRRRARKGSRPNAFSTSGSIASTTRLRFTERLSSQRVLFLKLRTKATKQLKITYAPLVFRQMWKAFTFLLKMRWTIKQLLKSSKHLEDPGLKCWMRENMSDCRLLREIH